MSCLKVFSSNLSNKRLIFQWALGREGLIEERSMLELELTNLGISNDHNLMKGWKEKGKIPSNSKERGDNLAIWALSHVEGKKMPLLKSCNLKYPLR